LLRGAGAAAAGAVAAGILTPPGTPALADNGSNLIAGQNTTATNVTGISGSVLGDAGLRVSNFYTGPFDDYSDALQAYTYGAGLAALYGRNDALGGSGVMGYSGSGVGGAFTGGLAPLRLAPAASTGPPTGFNHQQGELYVDSDGALWICTQSGSPTTTGTFQQVGGGAGAVIQIGQHSVSAGGGDASATLSGIPSTYSALMIVFSVACVDSSTSGGDSLILRFNGDSGGNYDDYSVYWGGTGSSLTTLPFEDTAGTGMMLARVNASGETSYFTAGTILIPDYASTHKYKTVRCESAMEWGGAAHERIGVGQGTWMSTSAVTSLTMSCAEGNIAQYSTITLYGVM
jgi:hypothetical protein